MNILIRFLPVLIFVAHVTAAQGQEVSLDRIIPATNDPNLSFNSTVSATSNFDRFLILDTADSAGAFTFSLRLSQPTVQTNVATQCITGGPLAHHIELSEDGETALVLSREKWAGVGLARAWLVDTQATEGFCPPSTPNQPQRGWVKLEELQSVGGLTGMFSQEGNWLVIGAPGAIVDEGSSLTGPFVTEGFISIYRRVATGWRQTYDTSIAADLGQQASLTPLNGETGAAVAISDNGATIAVSHPARRPAATDNPAADIPGGPMPADSGSSFPSGIFLGSFSQSEGLSWQFFELPSPNKTYPEVSAYPFQGIAEMNTNLRVSSDGDYVYYLNNELGDLGTNRVSLYTFQKQDESWRRSASQVLISGDAAHPQGGKCSEGTEPSWFMPGSVVVTDILVSSDQQRLAVAVVPEAGLSEENAGLVCLFEKDTLGHWQILEGSGSQSAAAMSSANLPFERNRYATDGITRLQGNDELSKVLVPSYNGAYVLNLSWEEAVPTGLPFWLLFEASKAAQN